MNRKDRRAQPRKDKLQEASLKRFIASFHQPKKKEKGKNAIAHQQILLERQKEQDEKDKANSVPSV